MVDKSQNESKIKMGMIGGGDYSLIGNTHRQAAQLSKKIDLIAGVFSSHSQSSKSFAAQLGLNAERSYSHWEEMLDREFTRPSEERIDGVIIITPNHLHFPIGKAFAESGFHIIMDKPLVHSSVQAQELSNITQAQGIVFAVTYNYTGFPMVKKARELIADGKIGNLRKVVVEYSQGWLTQALEREGVKKAEWRTDPQRSGLAGTIADIGTHAENLVATVTGLEIEELCADLTTLVPGRQLDDDGNLLIHYRGGARGVMVTSQVSCGENNLFQLKVYGERGGIFWSLEEPDSLKVRVRGEESHHFTHTPGSEYQGYNIHPSNLEAFTWIYREVARHIEDITSGHTEGNSYDYPTVGEGERGVRFIERAVASSQKKSWMAF